MLNAYQSNVYWQKAEHLFREESCRSKTRKQSNNIRSFVSCLDFLEQLTRQISPRRLSRDDPTLDFLLYIFEAIELLRVITN